MGLIATQHFSKKVHEPLVLLIKVQKPPLYCSWKVQNNFKLQKKAFLNSTTEEVQNIDESTTYWKTHLHGTDLPSLPKNYVARTPIVP